MNKNATPIYKKLEKYISRMFKLSLLKYAGWELVQLQKRAWKRYAVL